MCSLRVAAQMKHQQETGVDRKMSHKFQPPEQATMRTVLGSKEDEEKIKKIAE